MVMTQQLKARHRKPMKARRLGKSDEPTQLQMALFIAVLYSIYSMICILA